MPLKSYQSKIIVLLTRQELLVAEIYRFFAGLFPGAREFWNTVAEEELEHAGWLEYLYKRAQNDTVRFHEGRIKSYTVETFVRYLEENLARMKEKAPSLQQAFSLAVNIEKSLLVKNAFDHFESADRELHALLLDLRDKLTDHRERIEQMSVSAARPAFDRL